MRQDIVEGVRRLVARPAFTSIAVAILAIGIGTNTAIFSAVTTLLARPLPIPDGDRVVAGLALREGFDPFGTSWLEYSAYRDRSHVFAESGLALQRSASIAGRGDPEQVHSAAVTSGYMSALGVAPAIGRALNGDDDLPASPPVALIGYELWQRRFGGDPAVLGRPLPLDDGPATIIGVMPRGFDMPAGAVVWTTLRVAADSLPLPQRAATSHGMVARLRPGVEVDDADRGLKAIARELEDEYPQFRRGWSYRLLPLRRYLLGDLTGRNRLALLTLSAGVGCLLLICCANVANLLLVRGIARHREIAVRLALGATRGRIVRHLLVESCLLAVVGGAAGLLVATWLVPALAALNPIHVDAFGNALAEFRVDRGALAFVAVLTIATGLIFGALPAVRSAQHGDMVAALRAREQRTTAAGARWLAAVVVVEIAVAVVLLINGSLIVQSFTRLQHVDLGFNPSRLLTLELSLAPRTYLTPADRIAAVDRLVSEVRRVPGVISAGITTNVPLQSFSSDASFTVEGRPVRNPADVPITADRIVSPGYLQTLGVRLAAGRLLTERDRDGAPLVAVVTREFARQAWGSDDPIGRRVQRGRVLDPSQPWWTVVGVVEDVKEDRFNFRTDRPAWYIPYGQRPASSSLNLVVRTEGDPAAAAVGVRAAIRAFDAEQPVANVTTMERHLSDLLVTERFSALLMTALALVALLLAACGVYGVMAYVVGQQTAEIGVRIALGAAKRDVMALVMRRGLALIIVGLAAGTIVARTAAIALTSALYGIKIDDAPTFAGVMIVLGGSGLLACYLPARRAASVDPLTAIKTE